MKNQAGLGIFACGTAFSIVSTFGRAQKAALESGFNADIHTFSVISGRLYI